MITQPGTPAAAADEMHALNALVRAGNATTLHGLVAAEHTTNALGGVPLMGSFAAPRYGFKPTVVPAPSVGG
ncbi:hypothetical protein [Mycobacterium sp. E796]|uniref:hypothetical protein n=1 Tax=Mycobacterium sp. E796 TaxID=1834151 RepID=UPI0007FDBDC1|nr:hypothetical protein A5706_16755 [Mycobacterium sp. E796]